MNTVDTAAKVTRAFRRTAVGWPFLVPALVFFLGWQAYPIARVAWLSFTDYHFVRVGEPVNFVGLENYARAFNDPLVLSGLLRALVFTLLYVPGVLAIPLLAAILLDRVAQRRLQGAYRFLILLPAMIPGPLIFLLWMWLYSQSIGPINYILVDVLGWFDARNPPRWTADPQLVFPSIAIMHWWWGLGLHTMFFLAGLASIPRDLFDAARVDGANEWRLFWHITLPRLKPILLVLVVLRFGSAMALIEEYLIVGGLNRRLPSYTWTVYMWDLAFQIGDLNQSYAAAVGWIGAFAMLAVVAVMFWLFRPQD
jgi:multiple sugar transport system permease protein